MPGGGVALIRAGKGLESMKLEGDQQIGVNIIRRAIEEPLRWIATNAGMEGSIILAKVKEATGSMGYNAQDDRMEDLIAAGVIDPTKVVRSALQNASSIASLLLTTERLCASFRKRRRKRHRRWTRRGGMGGMY